MVDAPVTSGTSAWRDTGNTDRSTFIKAVSRSYLPGSSPMAADASSVYDTLYPYGLTRLGAAMLWHETKNWSWTCEISPQPCQPATNRNPWSMTAGWDHGGHIWSRYATFANAATDWAARMLDPQGPYSATHSLAAMLRVYAPASDGNDEARYVETIRREIDALPLAGGTPVANSYRTPAIYELYRDYAGFRLTQAQATKIGNHKFPGRSGRKPLAIVLHIQEGTTMGSLNWWASGNADASSTVMVQPDGSVLRVIPEADGPWTNGDANKPSAKGQSLITRSGGGNLNLVTLSVEMQGYTADRLSPAALNAICWQVTEWMGKYGLTTTDIYRHADINSVTRGQCPGAYFDQVMTELKGAAPAPAPVAWPGKPVWMPDAMVTELFPEATPNGLRTNAWLEYSRGMGRSPRRVKFHFVGTPQEMIEFSDGMLIFRDGRTSDWGEIA